METNVKELKRLGFSLKELAELVGCSVGLLHLEIRRGNLRAVRIGRRVIVPLSETEKLLSPSSTTR